MYLEHWKLAMKPFDSAPDARFYYRVGAHEGALAKLRYAAENRLGAGLLWGGGPPPPPAPVAAGRWAFRAVGRETHRAMPCYS